MVRSEVKSITDTRAKNAGRIQLLKVGKFSGGGECGGEWSCPLKEGEIIIRESLVGFRVLEVEVF